MLRGSGDLGLWGQDFNPMAMVSATELLWPQGRGCLARTLTAKGG